MTTSAALYFAYGSNMKTTRIQGRVPGVRPAGRAQLLGFRLTFNRRSTVDGTAKANLVESPGDVVWGVLFEIDPEGWVTVDEAEGGYVRREVRVVDDEERSIAAQTYISTQLTDDPRPTESYRRLIVEGALEHGLPEDYVAALEAVESRS